MSLVLFEIRDNIALLTLNNPDKRNMLTLEVCEMIVDYVDQAEKHPDVKALIVTGNGPTFCAGGQLSDITPDKLMLENIYSGFLCIAQCELPTIAAVNGPAVGAGFNMAVGCDVRIVTDKARLSQGSLALACILEEVIPGCYVNLRTGILLLECCFFPSQLVDKSLSIKDLHGSVYLVMS